MEVLESVKTQEFEFVAVKQEIASNDESGEDMESDEPLALQVPDVLEEKEEKWDDSSGTDISDMEQVPDPSHLAEMLQIEIKEEDDAAGLKEKVLNNERLLQSASGNCTTTPRETLIKPKGCVCDLCGEVFPNTASLNKHTLNNRKKPCAPEGLQSSRNLAVESWSCDICQKRFKSKDFLNAHLSKHTKELKKTVSSANEDSDSKECMYSCDVCAKPISQLSSSVSHKCKHVKPSLYNCEVCGKSFNRAGRLARHVMIHTDEYPHKCNVCDKSFRLLFHLRRHQLIHTKKQAYICDVCGKSYNRSDGLEFHKRTHSTVVPYNCDVCGKGFKYEANLKRHKRLHTGERPYICDICGRGFTVSSNMKEHRKSHGRETPIKKVYRCDSCGETFTNRHELKLLILNGERKRCCEVCRKQMGKFRRRRPAGVVGPLPMFDCEDCGKPFDCLSGLKRHRRTHTGERPYTCEQCGRSFSQAGSLKYHISTHMEGPPYVCDICGKCFDITGSLNKHKIMKHRI